MPEAMYFTGFWLLVWLTLTLDDHSPRVRWLVAGAVYGLLALVKAHALIFAPTLLVYTAYLVWGARRKPAGALLPNVVMLFATACVVKFALGYVLAGSAGLTWFGSLYGDIAETGASGDTGRFGILIDSLRNLRGHLMVVALLYGLPAAVVIAGGMRVLAQRERAEHPTTRFHVFAMILMANLLCAFALFTALAVTTGPHESLYRLHLRYYNFALPIFFIVIAGYLSHPLKVEYGKGMRLALIVAIGTFAVLALKTNVQPFLLSYVDNPELAGIKPGAWLFYALGSLSLFALLLWFVSPRYASLCYLFIFAPWFVAIAGWNISQDVKSRSTPDLYDNALLAAKEQFAGVDPAEVLYVIPHLGAFYRSAVMLEHAQFRVIARSVDDVFDLATIVSPPTWLFVMGPFRAPEHATTVVSTAEYSVVRMLPH